MGKNDFTLGDPILDLILWFIVAALALTVGWFFGGLILSLLVLKDGWDYASTGRKVGAVLLTAIGVVTVCTSSGNIAGAESDWNIILGLGPFVAAIVLGYAYSKRFQG